MADDFKGVKDIMLQSSDSSVPYDFVFSPCSSATANDGSLPNGTSVSTVVVSAYKKDTNVVNTQIVTSSSVSSNTVTANLSFPSVAGTGWYGLTFVVTLDTGAIMEFDFNRIHAEAR